MGGKDNKGQEKLVNNYVKLKNDLFSRMRTFTYFI